MLTILMNLVKKTTCTNCNMSNKTDSTDCRTTIIYNKWNDSKLNVYYVYGSSMRHSILKTINFTAVLSSANFNEHLTQVYKLTVSQLRILVKP